jgi:hypothetical protein
MGKKNETLSSVTQIVIAIIEALAVITVALISRS